MAPPNALASFKKKDGSLSLIDNDTTLAWTPNEAGASGLKIAVSSITNLQQTPVSNPKVMLKVFAVPANSPPNSDSTAYTFLFTAATDARTQADSFKEVLSTRLNMEKANTPSQTSTPVPGATGAPSAMAIASAVSSAASAKKPWEDDNRLKSDVKLQQALLKIHPELQRMFTEALRTKPDSLTAAQFMSQFWSTRLHLLRAYAIEQGQKRGSYNVLSSLKPRVEDNVTRLNISQEQIQLIFTQHPLVKTVYDENVPKLSEQQFWSRFFQSRLFKKLRGERITDADATDAILDKYLREEPAYEVRDFHVPNFLNLAGNEDDNSQRRGNRPDVDMRPSSIEKVPIIRTLNSLSEKIMATVSRADGEKTGTGGMDDEAWAQLQLRDLRGDEEPSHIKLNIRDQSQFFSGAKDEDESAALAKEDPEEVLRSLRADVAQNLPSDGTTQLQRLIQFDDDGDEEMKDAPASQRPVDSSTAFRVAFNQIRDVVREQRDQMEQHETTSETFGLSPDLYDRVLLTHSTAGEFIRQWWRAFLSGDPNRAGEVKSLTESLQRSKERIKAIADDADAERQVEIDRLKQHARDVYERTGRKLRMNLDIEGGAAAVNQLLSPTLNALDIAMKKYEVALAEEMKEMAAQGLPV
ncbi:General transcription and DNA repair factor IIH subunit tcf-29 [Penicillium malachiteum]|uniref:General transcription and DNA repair factor IIH subunit tcf-29 n=1 Tax=Penicillium malachiteum TaxID=1324776 RepID=UPI002546F88A|nr:General transcription and DNA repair factor IIH subunit tcf-29 [Penicillium malachiteum]KAJ5714467.1 General transcription and DNA repair factor IIH subunit tcf-29 [Penicillium malachiteum]